MDAHTLRAALSPEAVTLGPRSAPIVCESAWNKAPVFGVIGIQSGPRGRRVHSCFHGERGSWLGDADSGDDSEDPPGLLRAAEADQGDLPRVWGVAQGCAQGDPVAGDGVSL